MKKTLITSICLILFCFGVSLADHVVLLVDESGSMESIKDDTIGGMKSFVNDIKEKHPGTEIDISFFSTELRLGTIESYNPNGSTALYDAIAEKINQIDNNLKSEGKIVFAILTDGMENSSTVHTRDSVFSKIKHWEKWHDCEFIYLGANQDSFAVGQSIGIDSTSTYDVFLNTTTDVSNTFNVLTNTVSGSLSE